MGRTKNKRKRKQKSLVKEPFKPSGYFLIIAVCFIIPFIHFKSTIDPVTYPRLTALGMTLFILAVFMIFENGKKKINTIFLKNGIIVAFLFFIVVSVASLIDAVNPPEGLFDIFKWILVLLLTILTTFIMVSSDKFFYLLLKGVIISTILFSINGIVQYFTNAFMNTDPNALYEVKGLMGHKNQFSISLFVMIPFLLSAIVVLKKYWKKLAVLAMILALMVILILQTRSVWLAIIISATISSTVLLIVNAKKGIIQLKRNNQKRFLIGGMLVIFAIVILILVFPVGPLEKINHRINTVFNPRYTSNEWRIEMWDATMQLAKDQPLSGVGAGNWKISIYPYYSEFLPSIYRHWRNPHNDYLLTFSEKGLLGLIGFISIFFMMFYIGLRNLKNANTIKPILLNIFFVFGTIGYMVISFFSFPNERINHLIFLSLMASSILYLHLKQKAESHNAGIRKIWIIIPALILSYLAIHFGMISVNSEINLAKAQAAQQKKDWAAMEKYALKGYSKFAPIEPKHSFPVAMYIGIAKYNKGDIKESLDYFEKSFSQHPTNVSVMNNLGCVYELMNIPDSSIIYYGKTLDIFSHYEIGQINLAKAYFLNKDYENAYKTILHCDPGSSNQEIHQIRRAIEKKLE